MAARTPLTPSLVALVVALIVGVLVVNSSLVTRGVSRTTRLLFSIKN
jgi:hypothetical protein